jgi:hypothetical protein
MMAIVIIVGILAFAAPNTYAIDKITCFTEKVEYYQGEEVAITLTNESIDDIEIPDRKYIDGGFSVIEMKNDNVWKAIELFSAANIITSKKLKKNEQHVYVWKTRGYNRSDTLAIPGTYRVIFQNRIISNQFSVKSISNAQ